MDFWKDKRFLSPRQHRDLLWNSPSLLSVDTGTLYLGAKRLEREADHLVQLSRLRMCAVQPTVFHVPSCRAQGDIIIFPSDAGYTFPSTALSSCISSHRCPQKCHNRMQLLIIYLFIYYLLIAMNSFY